MPLASLASNLTNWMKLGPTPLTSPYLSLAWLAIFEPGAHSWHSLGAWQHYKHPEVQDLSFSSLVPKWAQVAQSSVYEGTCSRTPRFYPSSTLCKEQRTLSPNSHSEPPLFCQSSALFPMIPGGNQITVFRSLIRLELSWSMTNQEKCTSKAGVGPSSSHERQVWFFPS